MAAVKELTQIHGMDVYTPIDPVSSTPKGKRKALLVLFLLAKKCNGNIKGRDVTTRRK